MFSRHVTKRRTKTKGVVWRFVAEGGRDPRTGKRRRITRHFATKQEAHRELRRLLASLEDGSHVESSDLSVVRPEAHAGAHLGVLR